VTAESDTGRAPPPSAYRADVVALALDQALKTTADVTTVDGGNIAAAMR
jgi:hypothetical protein